MGTCALGRSGLSKDDWVNLCPEVRGTGILTGALWGGVALLRGSTESLCWEWGPQEQRHWSRILRTSLSEERQESREYGVQRGWGADFCGPVKRCRCESGVSLRGSTSAPVPGWAVGLAQFVTTPGSSARFMSGDSAQLRGQRRPPVAVPAG